MPSKYPAPTPKEVISALKAMGFWQVSQKGSHVKFTDGIRTAIVPMHGALSKWTFHRSSSLTARLPEPMRLKGQRLPEAKKRRRPAESRRSAPYRAITRQYI